VVVVHSELDDAPFEQTIREIKEVRKNVPVIGVSPTGNRDMDGADYMISSHDPQTLLQLLAEKFEAAKSDDDDKPA
jgi:hypothetical protein